MTTFPALSAADQIAAMEARAETERTIYGQTTVPEMLDQGAASGEEVERLRAALDGIVAMEPNRFHSGNRNDLIACAAWEIARAALSTPPQGPAVGEPEAMK